MRVSMLPVITPFFRDPFPPSPPSDGRSNAKRTMQPPEAIEAAKEEAHQARHSVRRNRDVLQNFERTRAAHKRQRRAECFVSKCLGVRWTVTPESYSAWLDSTPEIPF